MPPGASVRARPSTMDATCSTPAAPEAGSEAMEDMARHGSWPAPVFRYGELPYEETGTAERAALTRSMPGMSTGSASRSTAA